MVVSCGVLVAVAACGSDDGESSGGNDDSAVPASDRRGGSVEKLSDADTLLFTDLGGSLLDETSGNGTPKSAFAAYPFGSTRYDTSQATWKFAGTPRDGAVGLDNMGARFYAPELGTWTSGDPVVTSHPERLVTPEFAAANPYAYAKQSPVVAVDRDGHFAQVILGMTLGGLVGGGVEAARQYFEHGRVYDFGRVGTAAAGGMLEGTLVMLNPIPGLLGELGVGAAAHMGERGVERLIESGGKSAGTPKEFAIDGLEGLGTGLVAHGAGGLVGSVSPAFEKPTEIALSAALNSTTHPSAERWVQRLPADSNTVHAFDREPLTSTASRSVEPQGPLCGAAPLMSEPPPLASMSPGDGG